jgi:hypothetical protein
MSGGQIGTVVGGAIGAYFGGFAGAQLGMAIGGLVGGAIDPTQIKGPHIGDGQQQTATDGSPIAWILGTACVSGTIVQVSPRREKKKTDDGKGSGTETVTYEAHQDFAILVCESSETRNSSMSTILVVEQDGQIVYDVRPEAPDDMVAASAKWKQGVDFLYGGEDQMPHPTLEAITGVGNTVAYRGVCLAVFKDFNITKAGDRIPNFRFTIGAAPIGGYAFDTYFKYLVVDSSDSLIYGDPNYDDSLWDVGRGGFGTALGSLFANTQIADDAQDKTIWLRKKYYTLHPSDVRIAVYHDNGARLFWNEHMITTDDHGDPLDEGVGVSNVVIPAAWVGSSNQIALQVWEFEPPYPANQLFAAFGVDSEVPPLGDPESVSLANIVQRICERGGLASGDVDTSGLAEIAVRGYPIATTATASDCLAPLLPAYFAFGSEYDAQVHFRMYGADASLTVNPLDLVESDTGSDGGSLIAEDRNQATEYPRKITGSYYDPDQNYTVVNVDYERFSADIVALGEEQMQIPVVMKADDARQAIAKAMKVAYATLEGTREYSLPYVGHDGQEYLSLAAGDAVFFNSKRWSIDELTLGHNMLHFKTTYSRQSAYTSNVQAIPSNPPTPPTPPDSSVTLLYAMNLPSLRPQDTYGLYLAASGASDRWPGCVVQVSYDDGVTWVNGVQIKEASAVGVLLSTLAVGGASVNVNVNGELDSVGPAQIEAGANAAAILSDVDVAEIVQFETATETSADHYTLSDLTRGGLGTTEAGHANGERFTMLDSVYFLPIDLRFGGGTIKLRGVTLGTTAESATVVTIVYLPDDEVILDGGGDPL